MDPQQNIPPNSTNIAQNERVNNVKYIIYNILLIIIVFFLWWYAKESYDNYNLQKNNIDLSNSQTSVLKNQLQNDKQISQILTSMSGLNNAILQCTNDNICSQLDVKISKNINNIRSYYIINQMKTDQIWSDVINNDISNNLLTYKWENIWSIDSLNIKKSQEVDKKNHINKIPIDLVVKFSDNTKLVKFLQNIEKTISDNGSLLYKITDIYYSYTSQDWLKISMDLYYIDNKKKQHKYLISILTIYTRQK